MAIAHEAPDKHYDSPSLIKLITKQKSLSLGPATSFIIEPPSEGTWVKS